MSLHLQFLPDGDDLTIELKGDIDENVVFPEQRVRLAQRIVFECRDLHHINSYGAQIWSKWMRAKDERQQFVFRHVPPRVVDLFNLIEGYLPLETVVESFFVPYECDNCHYEELLLARRGHEYIEAMNKQSAKLLLPTEINCPKCKHGMKLGVWESKYLRFLEMV